MLVLRRKSLETIRVTVAPSEEPQVIKFIVVEAHGSVRIGIEAGDKVRIVRGEIEDQGERK